MNPPAMTTPMLLETYRNILLALGKDTSNTDLSRSADALEAEVNRRIAWG